MRWYILHPDGPVPQRMTAVGIPEGVALTPAPTVQELIRRSAVVIDCGEYDPAHVGPGSLYQSCLERALRASGKIE